MKKYELWFTLCQTIKNTPHFTACELLWKIIVFFCSLKLWWVKSSINKAKYAKSLQSYLALCNPIDSSPPGCPIPGILQARTLEWVVISFSNAWKWKVKVKSLSRVRLLAISWTAAHLAPPSMGFSRQEYWSGVPLPSPRQSIKVTYMRMVLMVFPVLTEQSIDLGFRQLVFAYIFSFFLYIENVIFRIISRLFYDWVEMSLTFHLLNKIFKIIIWLCVHQCLSHVWLFATPWTIYSPADSLVHGILQARILEWFAISYSRGSSQPRDHIAGRFFTIWATREAPIFLEESKLNDLDGWF